MDYGKYISFLQKYYKLHLKIKNSSMWLTVEKTNWCGFVPNPRIYHVDRHLISFLKFLYE